MSKVDDLMSLLPTNPADALLELRKLIQLDPGGFNTPIDNWDELELVELSVFIESLVDSVDFVSFNFNQERSRRGLTREYVTSIISTITDPSNKYVMERARSRGFERFEQYKGDIAPGMIVGFGYTVLSSDEKTVVHQHLQKIRSIIEKSDLDDRKRNAILKKLASLSKEVDKNGTTTDRFAAFMVDMAHTTSAMKVAGQDALQEAKEILKIVMNRRSENEGEQLPKPDEVLRLPNEDAS